jgi:hypothetical protein
MVIGGVAEMFSPKAYGITDRRFSGKVEVVVVSLNSQPESSVE